MDDVRGRRHRADSRVLVEDDVRTPRRRAGASRGTLGVVRWSSRRNGTRFSACYCATGCARMRPAAGSVRRRLAGRARKGPRDYSSCRPQSEHAPSTSGAAVPHAGHGSSSDSPETEAVTLSASGSTPSRTSASRQSSCSSAPSFPRSASWTRRCVLVPQPVPAPGGHPTRTGIPASRQRSRKFFMSAIEPDIAGTTAAPSSRSSAKAAVMGSMTQRYGSFASFSTK